MSARTRTRSSIWCCSCPAYGCLPWSSARSGPPHAAIGTICPPLRVLYALAYQKAADKRLLPLYLSMPPTYFFVLGALIGGIMRLVEGSGS